MICYLHYIVIDGDKPMMSGDYNKQVMFWDDPDRVKRICEEKAKDFPGHTYSVTTYQVDTDDWEDSVGN